VSRNENIYPFPNGQCVYRSDDGGANWVSIQYMGFLGMNVRDLDIFQDQTGDQVLAAVDYAGLNPNFIRKKGVYKSVDGGQNWSRIAGTDENPIPARCVEYSPASDLVMYYGRDPSYTLPSTIYKSEDGGDNWFPIGTEKPYPNRMIVLNSSGDPNNDTILVATYNGIYFSTTAGFIWDYMDKDEGLCDIVVMGVAASPQDHNLLIASTYSRAYRSTDFGAHWLEKTPRQWNIHMGDVSINLPNIGSSPFGSGTGYNFSLDRSANGGETWQFMVSFFDTQSFDVKIDVLSPDYLYNTVRGTGTITAGGTSKWFLPEIDCPTSTNLNTNLIPYAITTGDSYGNDNFIYWCGIKDPQQFNQYNFQRKIDDFTIEPGIINTVNTKVYDIDVIASNNPELLLAAADDGVFRSIDRGFSWENISEGIPVEAIGLEAELSDRNFGEDSFEKAYVGTDDGVYRCDNIGNPEANWILRNYGMATPSYTDSIVGLVAHPADNSVIYAAVEKIPKKGEGGEPTKGVFVSPDSARSWINITRNLPPDYQFHELDIHPLNQNDPATYPAQLLKMDTTYAASNHGLYKYHENIWPDQAVDINDDIYHNPNLPEEQTITWGPGLEIMHGDVIVPSSSVLNIVAPCTVLVVYDFDVTISGYDHLRSELIVNGELHTLGNPSNKIVFKSSRPGGGYAGEWKGIIAENGATVVLLHTEIFDAVDAITSKEEAEIYLGNCTIAQSSQSGVTAIYPQRFVIEGATFIDNNLYAITVMNENAEVILNTINISGVNRYGIRYFGFSPSPEIPLIRDVDIVYQGPSQPPPLYGIELGIDEIGYEPMGWITDVTRIEGYEDGIHLGGNIEGTKVGPNVHCIGNVNGILLDHAFVNIDGSETRNLFEENETSALLSFYSAGRVRSSIFVGGHRSSVDIEENGDEIDFGREEPEEDWGKNWIIEGPEGTEMLFYVNDCVFDYPAQMNWWGSDDEQYIDDYTSDCVIWDPFALEPPELPKLTSEEIELPKNLTLSKAYPNPFNANVTIEFILPKATMTSVRIYNILGQEICELYNKYTQAGETSVIWDGKDNSGSAVPSGVYFYAVRTDDEVKVDKMSLLK